MPPSLPQLVLRAHVELLASTEILHVYVVADTCYVCLKIGPARRQALGCQAIFICNRYATCVPRALGRVDISCSFQSAWLRSAAKHNEASQHGGKADHWRERSRSDSKFAVRKHHGEAQHAASSTRRFPVSKHSTSVYVCPSAHGMSGGTRRRHLLEHCIPERTGDW